MDYLKYGVAHELGHVWDRRTSLQLSNDLMGELGTEKCIVGPKAGSKNCVFDIWSGREKPPGSTNPAKNYASTSPMEDWAEAFASTLYPDYYKNSGSWQIGPLRKQYVYNKINSIP